MVSEGRKGIKCKFESYLLCINIYREWQQDNLESPSPLWAVIMTFTILLAPLTLSRLPGFYCSHYDRTNVVCLTR